MPPLPIVLLVLCMPFLCYGHPNPSSNTSTNRRPSNHNCNSKTTKTYFHIIAICLTLLLHHQGSSPWIALISCKLPVLVPWWQCIWLHHMQIICTSLQTDNHASTSPLSVLQVRCPSCCPTNSFSALYTHKIFKHLYDFRVSKIVCTLGS